MLMFSVICSGCRVSHPRGGHGGIGIWFPVTPEPLSDRMGFYSDLARPSERHSQRLEEGPTRKSLQTCLELGPQSWLSPHKAQKVHPSFGFPRVLGVLTS